MKRIYEPAAYAPLDGCWWTETTDTPDWPIVMGDTRTEIAVIGGGFTGLSAALHLAKDGHEVLVAEAGAPGFGASGRNGGFCCLGGAKASSKAIKKRVGPDGLRQWRATEKAAIQTVEDLITDLSLDVDRHSNGETLLAHTPRAWSAMQASVEEVRADYGVEPELVPQKELAKNGLGGPFHGALTIPLGFGLNPRKLHTGLANAVRQAGVVCHSRTTIRGMTYASGAWRLRTQHGTITADKVIVATNGYSSETVPRWMRARYLPVMSSVIVTRPLSQSEQQAQGWFSDQMAYDSRTLLHYFRKLPDNRFLFGMRGGLRATASATQAIETKIRQDFEMMFPAWQQVEHTHFWQGLACLTPTLAPFVGQVPGMKNVFASFGYHGNGVAMGNHCGVLLADLAQGKTPRVTHPDLMQVPPKRFPLGRFRRALLRPAYTMASLLDR